MDTLATERIKLIYEFNKNSPLFTRVAAIELINGNYLDAAGILTDGIKNFSNYPTAYFLLSLAKAYQGNLEEALLDAKKASELINSKTSFEYYSERIYSIIKERNSVSEVLRSSFYNDTQLEFNNEVLLEDKLDVLAEKLTKAKIIPKEIAEEDEKKIPEFTGKKIVSETLAEIHLSQKNFPEAISIYEELLNQKPEKAEFYLNKLEDIKSRMDL